ncbi:MAG: S9 family peptidase [Rikenellaceae bacterium]|nr:S9 family peptidase [Rikenellaceae bacterium]
MKKILLSVGALAACLCARADRFGYEELSRGLFAARSVQGVKSMADGEHYTAVRDGKLLRYAYATGEVTDTLYAGPRRIGGYTLSDDESKMVITFDVRPIYRRSFTARYLLIDLADGSERELVPEVERKRDLTLSKDGSKAAFVSDNNLYVYDVATGSRLFATDDGRVNEIINGATDWVYEEEFAFTRAFEFSPEGDRVAFLRFDESRVREFSMMRFDGQLYNEPYKYKYPKAGEANSVVELYVCDLTTGGVSRVETGEETDQYIPRIGWTPSSQLYFFRENRLQNRFEVLLAGDDLSVRRIYDESSPTYVERVDSHTVTFLPDGDRFVVRNETAAGYMHLYLYSISKGLLNPITSGAWEVTELVEVADGRVYYLSTEGSPLRRNLYSVKLNGRDKRRLTTGEGTYSVSASRGMRYFISYFSNASTPNVVTLHEGSGKPVRVLEENAALRSRIAEMKLPLKEFFTFTTERGDELNGYMVKPEGFDPERKYPVLMTQYSGPGSQSVADKWSLGWEDVMVQRGYLVVCVDGRGTGFRGEAFKKCTYGDLGRKEVEDQISAARYLAALPYVDASRIGIYGWSYGGFMALGCILKGADVFAAAVAVAPVTSWRFYDSVYTEVYNGLPQSNPKGYDENSPIHFAGLLRGKLLIVHGTGDDNVHVQNTYEMTRALTRAGKQFDMMIYTDANHSMVPDGSGHVRSKMIDWVSENL